MLSDLYLYVGSAVVIAASAVYFFSPSISETDREFEARYRRLQDEKRKAAKGDAAQAKTGDGSSSNDKNAVTKKVAPGGKVLVLFGSQTGTAESFSKTLVESGNDKGYFDVEAVDLEDFDTMTLKDQSYVIFVAATYGEGDPTDNAVDFMKFLNNTDGQIQRSEFASVKFTVFGLGNKQYEHYNAIGRRINSLMEQYGAQRVYPYGEGDDDSSLEEDFDAWRRALWMTLRKAHAKNSSSTVDTVEEDEENETSFKKTKPTVLSFHVIDVPARQTPPVFRDDDIQNSNKHFFCHVKSKLVAMRELRQSTAHGSTLHLEFDIKNVPLTYATADNLAIVPENDEDQVARVASALDVDRSQYVALTSVDTSKPTRHLFPNPCSIDDILRLYLDLNSAPRKGALASLAHYATNASERDRLLFLSSPDGKHEYSSWILDSCRTFADVLEEFPSLDVPWSSFLHICPSLQPRYYTISSSSTMHPNRIHVTVAVIQHECGHDKNTTTIMTTDDRSPRVFKGVCSNYVAHLSTMLPDETEDRKPIQTHAKNRVGEERQKLRRPWPSARMYIRPSTFKLPMNPMTPIIMVGPGTGIAPMRAFLQEREIQRQRGIAIGTAVLFFGCRAREEDFLYQDEFATYVATETLTHVYCAFSRERPERKVYVQHVMAQHGREIWNLLDIGAHVYVCGATRMGSDVQKTLIALVQEHGGKSLVDATAYVKLLQQGKEHRYIQELWSS
jgi:NADPH-ferrihemoprotein reductase